MKPARSRPVTQLTVSLAVLVALLMAIFATVDYRIQKQRMFEATLSRMNESARALRVFLAEGKELGHWQTAIRSYCGQMMRSSFTKSMSPRESWSLTGIRTRTMRSLKSMTCSMRWSAACTPTRGDWSRGAGIPST